MSNKIQVIVGASLLLVLALAWGYWWSVPEKDRDSDLDPLPQAPQEPALQEEHVPPLEVEKVIAPLVKELPPPVPELSPPSLEQTLRLPDGSYVPTLNGVPGSQSLLQAWRGTWGSTPFSPIVSKRVDQKGNEWYVHENGGQSSTLMSEVRFADGSIESRVTIHVLRPAPELQKAGERKFR